MLTINDYTIRIIIYGYTTFCIFCTYRPRLRFLGIVENMPPKIAPADAAAAVGRKVLSSIFTFAAIKVSINMITVRIPAKARLSGRGFRPCFLQTMNAPVNVPIKAETDAGTAIYASPIFSFDRSAAVTAAKMMIRRMLMMNI